MPGQASLDAHQYYAHPRNQFWPFMDLLLDVDSALSYSERCQALAGLGFAVWDVLKACVRQGSLDSRIQTDSIEVNDFEGFFLAQPKLERVFFNGGKAADLYRRKVLPTLSEKHANIPCFRLPSTSPANAGIPLAQKQAAWAALKTIP